MNDIFFRQYSNPNIINRRMEKSSQPKTLQLRRLNTMAESFSIQCHISSQYLKVLLFLGLVKNILKSTGKKIKDQEQKQNNNMLFLKKMYTNESRNCMDAILPIQPKVMLLKQTRQVYVDLKKQILSFLKQLKILSKPKYLPRPSYKAEKIKFPSENKLIPHENYSLVNNKSLMNRTLEQSNPPYSKNQQSLFGKNVVKISSNKYKYCANFRVTQNQNWFDNTVKFKKRVNNQAQQFKKYSSTLSKFYIAPDQCATGKGSFQIFDMYLYCLFQVKNSITASMDNILNSKSIGKQRVFYQIKQMTTINAKILQYFQIIGQQNQTTTQKIKQLQEKYIDIFEVQKDNQKQEVMLSKFMRKVAFMMQITKIIIYTPSINNILRSKTKILGNIFQKLAQFRYLARYLKVQLLTTHKSITKPPFRVKTQKNNEEDLDYQAKWKAMFNKKYKPINMHRILR